MITPAELKTLHARRPAEAVSSVQVLKRVLSNLEKRGEILHGSAVKILPLVLDAHSRPDESLRNLDRYLGGPDKTYANPEHRPAPEPASPLRTALLRFGVPGGEADRLYKQHAVGFAELATKSPLAAARRILVEACQPGWLGSGEEGLTARVDGPAYTLPDPAAWVKAKNISSF